MPRNSPPVFLKSMMVELFVALGIAMLVLAAGTAVRTAYFLRRAELAEATIVAVREVREARGRRSELLDLEFFDRGGVLRAASLRPEGLAGRVATGVRVPVLYDPWRPSRCWLNTWSGKWRDAVGFLRPDF